MRKNLSLLLLLTLLCTYARSENFMATDTFTYTINLDFDKNAHLRKVPAELLKGYCQGRWNGYYPKYEMNQCLFDDFLERFGKYQLTVDADQICWPDYCKQSYFSDFFQQFSHQLKFREVVYFDASHSVVNREVLWLQVCYSVSGADNWQHYSGPIFWMREINEAAFPILVPNMQAKSWTLQMEFNKPRFRTNEPRQENSQQQLKKYDKAEEH